MPVKHVTVSGTKEEIEVFKQAFPLNKSDRVLFQSRWFPHMEKHLGVELWDYCISKPGSIKQTVSVLKDLSKQHPRVLWEITWKDGAVVGESGEMYTNHEYGNKDYTGPFGNMCLRYDKPIVRKSQEEK